MTKNQYDNFLKEKASEAWTKVFALKDTKDKELKIKQIWKDFYASTDVPVDNFDLAAYNLPIGVEKVINAFCTTEEDNDDTKVLTGHCELNNIYTLKKMLECDDGLDCGYSGYFNNSSLKFILSFAEGDIYINLYKNEDAYKQYLEKTNHFYECEL